MGSVFLAERADREYQARVAIKLIRGFPTAAALDHLRRERQLLADLVHPHIARLLDGGTTPEGQPYLVIEYIEGLPLLRWCAERQPPLAVRLAVFQQLCWAVHYAHQKLIVHRDLKPGNVLVRADDTPVLLDFGIAKAIAAVPDGERPTELRACTPDYASPEQLAGGPLTTATDVYGLGLILYELLCGQAYQSGGQPLPWRESRPRLVAARAAAAWLRAEAAAIGGDLEHVVRRALADEPTRRYSSAAALATDLERHAAGLPVEAGPDRLGYRMAKFVRRHRLGVATGVLVFAALLGAAAWLATERARALRAERRAEAEARAAHRVTDFLLQAFEDADPEMTRGEERSARELLDRGSELALRTLTDEPAIRARLLAALGEIYGNIGVPTRSVELLRKAERLSRATHAPPLELAHVLHLACKAYYDTAEFAAAQAACGESLDLRIANLGRPATSTSRRPRISSVWSIKRRAASPRPSVATATHERSSPPRVRHIATMPHRPRTTSPSSPRNAATGSPPAATISRRWRPNVRCGARRIHARSIL
jgi:serine/threonine-protein kinase